METEDGRSGERREESSTEIGEERRDGMGREERRGANGGEEMVHLNEENGQGHEETENKGEDLSVVRVST